MLVHILKNWFEIGGNELGIRVFVKPEIDLLSGFEFQPIIWLPDFGAKMGTLVFEGNLSKNKLSDLACEAGYTASYMGAVNKSFEFSIDEFVDLLSDWGWSSRLQPRPEWLKDL